MRYEPPARRQRGPGLTPLIDVVFLLLVFFMLASRFEHEAALPLSVRVSPGPSGAAAADASVLRIDVDAGGATHVAARLVDEAALERAVAKAVRDGRAVRIRPDPETPLQPLVDLLGLAQRAGAGDVGLERPASGPDGEAG